MSPAARTTTTLARPGPAGTTTPSPLLQRKCACGGAGSLGGECEDCRRGKLVGKPLQRKLAVGAAGDAAEREADRIGEAVLRPPWAGGGLAGALALPLAPPVIQRRAEPAAGADRTAQAPARPEREEAGSARRRGEGEARAILEGRAAADRPLAPEAPPIVHEVLASPGEPLDAASRSFFEPRLGRDLRDVRVHAGARAAESARSVDARAYTVGRHVVLGPGAPAAGTAAWRQLLGHELVHVAQQGAWAHPHGAGAPAGVLQRLPFMIPSLLMLGGDVAPEPMVGPVQERERGPSWQEQWDAQKAAGYGYLIEESRALQQWCIEGLREHARGLPSALQPIALGVVEGVARDLAEFFDLLFFIAGLIVGLGEGVVETLAGLGALMEGIVRVAWHVVMASIFDVQERVATLGLRDQPDEALIQPLAEDLLAAQMLWHDLCHLDLIGFLSAWLDRFQQASREQKAIMAGDFVADLVLFYATWEVSAARLGKVRLPRLPPPAPEAVPVLVGAGRGGTIALGAEATGTAVHVGVGGPLGAGGATVAKMAGRSRGEQESAAQRWADEPLSVLEEELEAAKKANPKTDFGSLETRLRSLIRGPRPVDREAALELRQELFQQSLPGRRPELPEALPADAERRKALKIQTRGETAEEKAKLLAEDFQTLKAREDIRDIAYDPGGPGQYRVPEAVSVRHFIDEGIIAPEAQRSVLEYHDVFDPWSQFHYSVKADFRNVGTDGIVGALVEEIGPGRNLLVDLDAAGIDAAIQDRVVNALEIVRRELGVEHGARRPFGSLRDELCGAGVSQSYAAELATWLERADRVEPQVYIRTRGGVR